MDTNPALLLEERAEVRMGESFRTRPQAALMRFQGKSFWVVENTQTIQSPHLHGLQTTVLLSPLISPELASFPSSCAPPTNPRHSVSCLRLCYPGTFPKSFDLRAGTLCRARKLGLCFPGSTWSPSVSTRLLSSSSPANRKMCSRYRLGLFGHV